jgi:hypothetical protein
MREIELIVNPLSGMEGNMLSFRTGSWVDLLVRFATGFHCLAEEVEAEPWNARVFRDLHVRLCQSSFAAQYLETFSNRYRHRRQVCIHRFTLD